MTVRRGEEWGVAVTRGETHDVQTTDAAVAAAVADPHPRPTLVRGGDLHRSLGAPSGSAATRRLPLDVVTVTADDRTLPAVAHVVARRRGPFGWWRGPIVAVCNVDHLGNWDVAPRAHPNDGVLDVIEVAAAMPVRERWKARRRLPTGTHVPHPDITIRRVRDARFAFERPLGLWVDGVACGTVRSLAVVVEPDAAEIYV